MLIVNRVIVFLLLIFSLQSCVQGCKKETKMNWNKLTPEEASVILHKGTEYPFTGEYVDNKVEGVYICRQCNAPLYLSKDKFDSHCGWPSFDDEIAAAVLRIPDEDGRRTEIICANCKGHLGHVFLNEGFTLKNTRHCVNSISLKFIPNPVKKKDPVETAYFASGCFWGTEYHFMKAKGVTRTAVGFMGGHSDNPTYREVCSGTTGHIETTEVLFDPKQSTYDDLVKLFFETHDFTQTNGQGPDIGEQYLSVIFYNSEEQKNIAQKYIDILTQKGYKVATSLRNADVFWEAEEYHQAYYQKKDGSPYCHSYKKIF